MIIFNGCAKPVAKIVKFEDFCEGRYESLWLEKKDFDNIDAIRLNEAHRITIDKYINYHAINEKEYQLCLDSKDASVQ